MLFSVIAYSQASELEGFDVDSVSKFGGKVEFVDNEIVLSLPYKIHFDFDKDEIKASDTVDALAAFLVNSTEPMTLVIEGHADEVGSINYNQDLSMRRASELKRYLVMRGLDHNRVEIIARSKELPLESTGKPSRKNRRLELSILRK